MIEETWNKVWCPNCNKPNWFCLGDLNDLTGTDIEACQCFSCDHMWWASDEHYDCDCSIEDCLTKGKESP